MKCIKKKQGELESAHHQARPLLLVLLLSFPANETVNWSLLWLSAMGEFKKNSHVKCICHMWKAQFHKLLTWKESNVTFASNIPTCEIYILWMQMRNETWNHMKSHDMCLWIEYFHSYLSLFICERDIVYHVNENSHMWNVHFHTYIKNGDMWK